MSIPDPIAAATGSGTISTSRAPAWYVASSTAFRSTSVTPDGTQMLILGFRNALLPHCLLDKVAQHALGDQKVRDHALPHGPDRHNIARCPSNHLTRFFSNCPYFICIFIIRNYGRLL